jgi:hypothetical protein
VADTTTCHPQENLAVTRFGQRGVHSLQGFIRGNHLPGNHCHRYFSYCRFKIQCIRLRQNTLQLTARYSGEANRVEARKSEDGLATTQFR